MPFILLLSLVHHINLFFYVEPLCIPEMNPTWCWLQQGLPSSPLKSHLDTLLLQVSL
jgi:hypothetical protein